MTPVCAHCEELREEIEYLQSELGMVRQETAEANLRLTFGLPRTAARILIALAGAKGKTLTSERIVDLIDSDATSSVVAVYAVKIRKRVGLDAMLTDYGKGFRIGPSGLAAVQTARSAA